MIVSQAAFAYDGADFEEVINTTAKCIYETTPDSTVASIGGEWAVLGLARSGAQVPDSYFEKYYENAVSFAKSRGGVLHDKKYTEYSRVILALTAIGKNPENVGGYNLLIPLGDYEKNRVKKAISVALEFLSKAQNENGGFSSWGGENSESDSQVITALCALGIPMTDARFVKNGHTAFDNLMTFYDKDTGFRHTYDESVANRMSAEQ